MGKIDVFLDTNVIEIQNKKLFKFEFNGIYYKLRNFITYNNYNNFKIIIPQIVLDEMYKHYIEEYESIQKKLENLNDSYSAIKADMIKIGYDVNITKNRYANIDEYKKYIKQNFDKYILEENKYFEIIPYPSQDKFYNIIERAIQKKRPFFFGGNNDKKFSDAGFKDVVLLESIKEKMEEDYADYIIVTNDNILNGLNWNEEIDDRKGKSTNAKSDIDIIEFICNEYELKDMSEYYEFSKEEYFKEKIKNVLDLSIAETLDIELEEYDDQNIIKIKCRLENNKNIDVILDETKEFICIMDENDEIIYQW